MEISEKSIENYLKQRARECGFLCYKFASPSNAGVCDRILIDKNGVTYFIELKNSRGRLSPLQKKFIKDMHEHKKSVFILGSKLEVDRFIRIYRGS